jgi:hypothetical protein
MDKTQLPAKFCSLYWIHEYMSKRPHYFFRIQIILPKRRHFFLLPKRQFNFCFLLKRWYHVWYLVIQDLSSKFIYCIYMFILGVLVKNGGVLTCIRVFNIENKTWRDWFLCFIIFNMFLDVWNSRCLSEWYVIPCLYLYCSSSIYHTTQNNPWICRYRFNGKVF